MVIGTGLSKPYLPEFQGSEHVVNYADVSTNPKDFEGKTVLILGERVLIKRKLFEDLFAYTV